MTIQVNPDWWKTLFDEVYLVTDARTVDNNDVTRHEIDVFSRLLPLSPEDHILDLCGGHGRHMIELCRRGYQHCTVLDYSQTLLRIGATNAQNHNYPIQFIRGDARRTQLESKSFNHVMLLGNSLGYISDDDADLHILKECRRLLKPGGWLLLDVTDGMVVRNSLAHTAWHEVAEDVVVCRQREIRNNCVCAREMVLSKTEGLIRDATYCIRLYDSEELVQLVINAGFHDVIVKSMNDTQDPQIDRGCMNHRLLTIAQRA